jgi:hypothetical protein
MNKITKLSTALFALVVFAVPSVFAATATSGPVNVSAVVDGSLSMSVLLKRNSSVGPTVTSMNFGRLEDIGTGTLRSSEDSTTGTGNVSALISANSHGLRYTITQTGTALSNGTTTLPAGACTVVPLYVPEDNAGLPKPAAAVVGTAGTWVATNKVLYQSETGIAAQRTIQAIYSITDDEDAGATTGVPTNQPGGTYNGTVTFTVTA